MDRSSNNGMYILFTKSHEILANPIRIYVVHTYEERQRIKKIFDANWNLRQIQVEMD